MVAGALALLGVPMTRVRGHWAFKACRGPVNSLIWLDFDWELRGKRFK